MACQYMELLPSGEYQVASRTHVCQDTSAQGESNAKEGSVWKGFPEPLDGLSRVPGRASIVQDAGRDLTLGTASRVDDACLPLATF